MGHHVASAGPGGPHPFLVTCCACSRLHSYVRHRPIPLCISRRREVMMVAALARTASRGAADPTDLGTPSTPPALRPGCGRRLAVGWRSRLAFLWPLLRLRGVHHLQQLRHALFVEAEAERVGAGRGGCLRHGHDVIYIYRCARMAAGWGLLICFCCRSLPAPAGLPDACIQLYEYDCTGDRRVYCALS